MIDAMFIFQAGGHAHGHWILLTVSCLFMSLPTEGKVYQQTKFRRDISIGCWDITTSVLEVVISQSDPVPSTPFPAFRRVCHKRPTDNEQHISVF